MKAINDLCEAVEHFRHAACSKFDEPEIVIFVSPKYRDVLLNEAQSSFTNTYNVYEDKILGYIMLTTVLPESLKYHISLSQHQQQELLDESRNDFSKRP